MTLFCPKQVGAKASTLFVILALALGLATVPAPAQAAASSAGWSFQLPGSSTVTPLADGSVLSRLGSPAAGTNHLENVSPTGTSSWHLSAAAGQYVDYGAQATDARGVVYYHLTTGDGEYLVANDHGIERWRISASVSNSLVTVGANGQVYTIKSEGSGNTSLHGYSAQTGAALFDPIMLDYTSYGPVIRLLAYNGGLVVQSGFDVAYFDFTGTLIGGPYGLGHDGLEVTYHDVALSATGDLFSRAQSNGEPIAGCPSDTYSRLIIKVTPAGVAWRRPAPQLVPCTQYGSRIVALPDGGAVFGVTGAAGDAQQLQFIDGNGQLGWNQPVPAPVGPYNGAQLVADDNGQVLYAGSSTFDCGGGTICSYVLVSRFTAGGAALTPITIQGPSDSNQENWGLNSSSDIAALTPGNVVLSTLHSRVNDFTSIASLTAFPVPGLGAQYPQSSLWALMPGAGTPTPSPSPTPMTPPAPSAIRIAALGDSVASGEGTRYRWHYVLDTKKGNVKNGVWNGIWAADQLHPTWEPTTNSTPAAQNCHRSTDGYPYQVAKTLKADLWNAACSGASAGNGILRHQVFGDTTQAAKPQLGIAETLYDPPNSDYDAFKPSVVTLTLGANDLGFAKFVETCYKSANNTGNLSRFCDTNRQDLERQANALLKAQKANLDKVINEIIRRGRAAGKVPLIMVTTYYDPFPDAYRDCRDILPGSFLGKNYGLSPGEMAWLKIKLLALNDNIRAVSRRYPQVKVVNLESAFSGHQWCSKDPWAYGPSIAIEPGQDNNPSPFHPTQKGQAVIGAKIANAIKQMLG